MCPKRANLGNYAERAPRNRNQVQCNLNVGSAIRRLVVNVGEPPARPWIQTE